MRFVPTEIPEVVLIETPVYRDPRGYFLETFHARKFGAAGLDLSFVQDNHSYSASRGVLRGLHAQLQRPQGKLVRAILGEIWDVAADVRPGSPTYGRWVARTLSSTNFHQLYIPPGFVHGFCVVSDEAHVEYKCTALYDPSDEISVAWDDPDLGIAWPVGAPLLNAKDRAAPRLAELAGKLETWRVAPAS